MGYSRSAHAFGALTNSLTHNLGGFNSVVLSTAKSKLGYFIDRMPNTIRCVLRTANTVGNLKISAQPFDVMDYWRNNPRSVFPGEDFRSAEWARYIVDFDELAGWSKATQMPTGQGATVPQWIHRALDPWNVACKAIASYVVEGARKATKPGGPTYPFPNPAIDFTPGPINDPNRNDIEWYKKLMKWDVHFQGDGGLELNTTDPLALYIGRFGWQCIPMGYLEWLAPKPGESVGEMIIHINLVGVFGVDKYEFNNSSWTWDQPLGEWNVDAGSEGIRGTVLGSIFGFSNLISDAGYYPPMDWCYVTNNVFNRYRHETGRGRDFIILTNVKVLAIQRAWSSKDDGKTWQEKLV